MVEAIIRLTAAAVVVLAATNALQGARLGILLARAAQARVPRLGARMWRPLFTSVADVRDWLTAWGTVLTCDDAPLLALRLETRTVVTRYFMLVLWSNAWAIAVWTLLLPSAVSAAAR